MVITKTRISGVVLLWFCFLVMFYGTFFPNMESFEELVNYVGTMGISFSILIVISIVLTSLAVSSLIDFTNGKYIFDDHGITHIKELKCLFLVIYKKSIIISWGAVSKIDFCDVGRWVNSFVIHYKQNEQQNYKHMNPLLKNIKEAFAYTVEVGTLPKYKFTVDAQKKLEKWGIVF